MPLRPRQWDKSTVYGQGLPWSLQPLNVVCVCALPAALKLALWPLNNDMAPTRPCQTASVTFHLRCYWKVIWQLLCRDQEAETSTWTLRGRLKGICPNIMVRRLYLQYTQMYSQLMGTPWNTTIQNWMQLDWHKTSHRNKRSLLFWDQTDISF